MTDRQYIDLMRAVGDIHKRLDRVESRISSDMSTSRVLAQRDAENVIVSLPASVQAVVIEEEAQKELEAILTGGQLA